MAARLTFNSVVSRFLELGKRLIYPTSSRSNWSVSAGHLEWFTSALVSYTSARGRLSKQEFWKFSQALESPEGTVVFRTIGRLFLQLGLKQATWRSGPSETLLPMVSVSPNIGLSIIYGLSPAGEWLVESMSGRQKLTEWPEGAAFTSAHAKEVMDETQTADALFRKIFTTDRSWLWQAGLASLIASVLALATSLYTMQVYDRVISTGGIPTLVVLSVGVVISIFIELGIKVARATIINRATQNIDLDFASGVFNRMLNVRLDQFPANVGTLAAQVRGFEVVRGFKVAATLYFLTDAPFALFFLVVIFMLGGPYVAAVPTVALVVALAIGASFKASIRKHSKQETLVGNRRQGLLIETINCAETLKGSGAGWKMLGRWNELSSQTIDETMQIKHLNDLAGFLSGWIQQVSYVSLVATGAWLATSGSDLTIGSIIACSIISGRVLTPINMLPGLMSQWGHAQVSMENLERLFELEKDNHNTRMAISPETIAGAITMMDVEFSYPDMQPVVVVNSLHIAAGEKVAVLGTTGAGKSTFLKLCAGLYKPGHGGVFLDGLDLQQVSAERRADAIGYLAQRSGMFSGTLRDNLLLGLPACSDEEVLSVCEATGLDALVRARPEGLDMRISEGGTGLSGGQSQLAAITRLMLARPEVWLLDEPTAALDEASEDRVLAALKQKIASGQTAIIVTHRMKMLDLVDRIIILTPQGIALDGPKEAVVDHLMKASTAASAQQGKVRAYPVQNNQVGSAERRVGQRNG
ncbi:ATP-binding cassette domain-containing protein [Parvibaculum lavamentivorans]|nr:ATP-binding cassette domain-containing protein [Parvibaculum lavamentivorans]